MKFISYLIWAACGATLLVASSCKKETLTPAPAAMGSVVGYAAAVDENGAPLDKAGIAVTIDDATPQLTTTTDANGKYAFDNVAVGTYSLTYTRAGLGTLRRFSVGHLGGPSATILGTSTLTQPSTTVASALTATGPTTAGNFALKVAASNPAPGTTVRVALFAGTDANVTAATGTLLGVYTVGPAGMQTLNLSPATLHNAGFASGTSVYAVAYGAPVINVSYVNPDTNHAVYTSLNATASPIVNFVAP